VKSQRRREKDRESESERETRDPDSDRPVTMGVPHCFFPLSLLLSIPVPSFGILFFDRHEVLAGQNW
jgi:hypothetical protein